MPPIDLGDRSIAVGQDQQPLGEGRACPISSDEVGLRREQIASADGTRIVTRFHSRQRHAKAFFGIEPTGRVILFDETHVTRLAAGLIVENIVSATNLEFEMLMAPVLAPLMLI